MWSVDLLSIAGHSTVTTQGENVGMDGNSGVQISAPSDGYVEILVGDDAESAQPSASSPVGPGQNVSVTDMGNYSYAKVAPHTHELTYVPAVDPTPAKPGNIEYWLCEACGTYFADAEGAQEITEADTYLAPEGTADIPGSNEGQVGGGDWDWPSSSGGSTSGSGSGTTTGGKENPSTGDSSLMAGAILLAAASVGGILLSKKRK